MTINKVGEETYLYNLPPQGRKGDVDSLQKLTGFSDSVYSTDFRAFLIRRQVASPSVLINIIWSPVNLTVQELYLYFCPNSYSTYNSRIPRSMNLKKPSHATNEEIF
jgi:hypothetical protein